METLDATVGPGFFQKILSVASIGIRPAVTGEKLARYREAFANKEYARIVARLLGDIDLNTRIGVSFLSAQEIGAIIEENCQQGRMIDPDQLETYLADRFGQPALIEISPLIPPFGTAELGRFKSSLKFSEFMKDETLETFVRCTLHELMHILLAAHRHPLKESEIAVELAILAQGYGDIYQSGSRLRSGKTIGYLNDLQFAVAHESFKILLAEQEEVI
jgi:hypothetical protein